MNHTIEQSYTANRKAFLTASQNLGHKVHSYGMDKRYKGIDGETLAMDVVVVGDPQSPIATVISSGLHGVELPFGSALQRSWMESATELCNSKSGAKFIFVHALNPYGASHGLRNNERNIELNRSFLKKDEIPETSQAYIGLANAFLPRDVSFLGVAQSFVKILSYVKKEGAQALRQAVVGGQYLYPDGIFFGGNGDPTWTAETFEKIIDSHVVTPNSTVVIPIELHSGVGTYKQFQALVNDTKDSVLFKRAEEMGAGPWLQPLQEKFASVTGDIFNAWKGKLPPNAELVPMVVEAGTTRMPKAISQLDLLMIMIHRNALLVNYDDKHPKANAIIQKMRDAFVPQDPDWVESVMDEGNKFFDGLTRNLEPKLKPKRELIPSLG